MGSLSNLYISQSYQSLAHLGTNTSLVPGTMTQLQDGIGQSLNISFDGTNISSSGNIFAANITGSGGSSINTGSLVTTSSFNSYTSSTNARLSSIETTTASLNISVSALNTNSASVNISISNLNTATASLFTSSSNALYTASFDNGTRNLTFTKGNNTTFNVNIPDVSGSTINTGSFATTSSFNSYTQSNDQRVTSLEVNSASVNISISNINTTTASLLIETQNLELFSASALISLSNINQFTQSAGISINALNSATSSYITESETSSFARTNVDNNFSANQTFTNITAVSASFQYVQTLYETASVIYSSGSNQFGDELSDIQTLSGSVKVQGSLTVNGTPVLTSSVDISGLVTTSSFNAYTSSTNLDLAAIHQATASLQQFTASFNTASFVGTASFNAYTASSNTSASLALVTASFDNGTRNLTFTKGDTQTFSVNIPDVSGSTGNFATTGSNVFVGNQTISGSLIQSSSNSITTAAGNSVGTLIKNRVEIAGGDGGAGGPTGRLWLTGTDGRLQTLGGTFQSIDSTGINFDGGSLGAAYSAYANPISGAASLVLGVYTANTYDTDIEFNINTDRNGTQFKDWDNVSAFDYIPFMTLAPNNGDNPAPVFTRGLQVTGSTQVQNFTASLQQGYVYVGNASGRTTTVATSSFATAIPTGTVSSSAQILNYGIFATTGSNTFFGQQTINLSGTAQTVATSIIGNSTQVETDMYVDGGNYDTFNVFVSASNGVYLRDFDQSGLSTWLRIPTNTGNNPAPIMPRGLNVTGTNTNLAKTGSNTFTGQNVFNNQVKFGTSTISDSFSEITFQNNQSLSIATKSTVLGGLTGSFQTMTMTTGSGGQASFQMTAQISGTIGELKVTNSAGTSSVLGFADDILFAKKQGFPNTPATTFTAEATTISLKGLVNVSGSVNFATGSNKQAGTAVLDGANPGTVTVSNSLVTANSIIMVSKQTLAHPNGYVAVSAKSAGSFTITSNHNGDTDTVGWFIINNS